AWSAIWLDRDNDGTLEILVAPGDLWAVDEAWDEDGDPWDLAPILLQDHDGAFRDVAAEVGLTTEGSWRTLVAADHNADGVLDLLLTDVVQRPLLYLSEGCTDAAWLEIEATVGSRIEVTAGERTWTGWTTRDSAMGGGRPSVVHLGLGDVGLVDELRVETPQGEVLRATLFEPRRRIAVD
ncbi:MAG: FG-GAP-like repeat-containing protein, partial [Myxococcota bacterium]|nr:FG-GAP-like repeat-containing protein [Myxococcota bacterium]